MEINYIKIVTWIVMIVVVITLGKRLWELITKGKKTKEKWQDFLED